MEPKKLRSLSVSREEIQNLFDLTRLTRAEIAETLGVNKSSTDRWITKGIIKSSNLQKLRYLVYVKRAKISLEEYSLDELTGEIEKRGWVIQLESKSKYA